jgi:signal transduction histidine kinase
MKLLLPILFSLCTLHSSASEQRVTQGNASVSSQPAAKLSGKESIATIKQRLADIDSQLDTLANYNPRSGVGVGGFRSKRRVQATHPEWIEIDLGQSSKIDEIVLVPEIRRSSDTSLKADGFPQEFRILAGKAGDREGKVIASFTREDQILPRIAPLVIPCDGIEASWIRLEVSELSPRTWDSGYSLHLFEILVFSGSKNIALHQPVKVSSQNLMASDKYHAAFLVDGFLPYVMDAAKGERSNAFLAPSPPGRPGYLVIDLGKAHSIDQVYLHAVDLSDAIPQKRFTNFGMPRHLIIEGANIPDYSDAEKLTEFRVASVFAAGPIMMKKFPASSCRYVRLRVIEPSRATSSLGEAQALSNIGFAEIELFSDGINVAKAKQANGNYGFSSFNRSYTSLTDGRNFYGEILPIRQWLNELALRHELERQRPQIKLQLDGLYEDQKKLLNRLAALAIILAAGIIVTLLVTRLLRMRQIGRIRERLAADLHDELGANLHTIGLLSDLALDSRGDEHEFSEIHRRIRSESARSSIEVRNSMDLLAMDDFCANLEEDMQRAARRIMAKLDHELTIEGKSYLKKLKSRIRVDLFLFYKECLVNISRHSGASAFSSHLSADQAGVTLIIRDNGIGIDKQADGLIPNSLQRRARLLGAKVRVDHPAEGGTRVTLTIPAKKLTIFKSIYQ